jgi:hypothetical protein|tara:strand:+ start:742 stop:1164 length:423 start_codon:yes stop_codon:yes gene_type:complete
MAKTPTSNIEKAMSGGGRELPSLDMNKFIELADAEKINADAQNDLFEAVQDKYLEQKRPGESFDSWLKRTPVEELRRIELSNGGSIVDLSKYRKDKKPTKIKELNLSSVLGGDTPVSSLSEKDKETVLMLLKMSGIGNKD